MVEKIRVVGGEWTAKKWVAVILFFAIIVVFVFLSQVPSNFGDASGGVAAVVNNRVISMAEFRAEAEYEEAAARQRLETMPEQERRMRLNQVRAQVMERMVLSELIFQEASSRGVIASDAEVKDQILQIPFLQENGRFSGDRYRTWLQNRNSSIGEFENQIRRQIVISRVQELFVGSSHPSREELKLNRTLADIKLNLRFGEISRDDLNKLGNVSDAEIADYSGKHKSEIEAYYKDNQVEFTRPERYHAKDILIRIDGKRPEAEAQKLALEVQKQATTANFAKLAAKYSEDPGSKAKGGDLGERDRGSMAPQFEEAVLALEPGKASAPVKLMGGFHVILLESKKAAVTEPLEKVEAKIAHKLLARSKESEIIAHLRGLVEKGDKKELDALFSKSGLKWQETGEFDLSTPFVPKLGDAKEILPAVLEKGHQTGLVRRLIPVQSSFVVVDVLSWKRNPDTNPEIEGLDRMLAYRKSEGALMDWARQVEARSSVQRNTRLIQ